MKYFLLMYSWPFVRKVLVIQLNLGLTDVKGPSNFIHCWRIFLIANIGDKEKWFEGTIV